MSKVLGKPGAGGTALTLEFVFADVDEAGRVDNGRGKVVDHDYSGVLSIYPILRGAVEPKASC